MVVRFTAQKLEKHSRGESNLVWEKVARGGHAHSARRGEDRSCDDSDGRGERVKTVRVVTDMDGASG